MALTKIFLLNVPFESDYKHTLYFGSRTAQLSYFQSRIVDSFQDCSYQRKNNTIKVPEQYDNVLKCNYVLYQNSAYTDKWFFAFIKDTRYINDENTEIEIETDVIQTWMFDYTIKTSFIEREHVKDDTIGLHTIEEGLEYGEYISNSKSIIGPETLADLCYILASTADPTTGDDVGGGVKYNGIYSGVRFYRYDDADSINTALKKISKEGKLESVLGLFMSPKDLTLGINFDETNEVNPSNTPGQIHTSIDKNTQLNGYTPKNNKLLCYPYNYIGVSNGCGGSAIYRYEWFADDICWFDHASVLTPGISTKLIPQNYKGVEVNHDEALTGGKYPICSFAGDMYTNWMVQNSTNHVIGIGAGAASIGIGLASIVAAPVTGGASLSGLAIAGAVAGGVGAIANTLGQIHSASFMSDHAQGNVSCGDVTTAKGANCFHVYQMSIRKEFAEILDEYFNMFGYKCHEVKVPNKNHRENYWFTKTIDANITGSIPMSDLNRIKDCYNAGITFWKNPANIKNYNVTNKIV